MKKKSEAEQIYNKLTAQSTPKNQLKSQIAKHELKPECIQIL